MKKLFLAIVAPARTELLDLAIDHAFSALEKKGGRLYRFLTQKQTINRLKWLVDKLEDEALNINP